MIQTSSCISGVTLQIVGALAAGFVGLVTQVLAIQLRKRREENQWEDRTVRLCNRLCPDLKKNPDDDSIRLALYAYLDILPLLESHLADAPYELSESLWDSYEDMYELKKHYENRNHVSASENDAEKVRKIQAKAQSIKDEL